MPVKTPNPAMQRPPDAPEHSLLGINGKTGAATSQASRQWAMGEANLLHFGAGTAFSGPV
jgi:hypothetical protein